MTRPSRDIRIHIRHVAGRLAEFGAPYENSFAVLQKATGVSEVVPARTDVTPRLSGAPQFVVAGWACTMRPDARGKRQIFGFVLPGDILGSFWRRPSFAFYRLVTLTRLVTVSGLALAALDADGGWRHPALMRAARRAEDHAQHLLIDHVVRLGARDAYAGLAHLLLEFHARLNRVGLADDGVFQLPVGQRTLAQALGFSVVHTNHTLQRMTADRLFRFEQDTVRLLQPDRMAELSGFTVSAANDHAVADLAMDGLQDEPEVHRDDQRA